MNLKQNFLALYKIYDQQEKLLKLLEPLVACNGNDCSDCCKKVAIRTTMLESANICKYLSTIKNIDMLKNIKHHINKYDALFNNIRKSYANYFVVNAGNSETLKIQNDIVGKNIDACPFLLENSCSIYPARPLVCRQYVVDKKSNECLGSVNTSLIDNKDYSRETLSNISKLHRLDATIFGKDNTYYLFIGRAIDFTEDLMPLLLFERDYYICNGNQFEKLKDSRVSS